MISSLALVERAGERIGKNEGACSYWPDAHVIERKSQSPDGRPSAGPPRRAARPGDSSISCGERMCFVAPSPSGRSQSSRRRHRSLMRSIITCGAIDPLIGRDGVVAKLIAQLTRCRLLTIVGSGGIGKTSVALAVAERLVDAYEDGVWVIDLSLIVDPDLVLAAVAGAVGVKANPGLTTQTLVAALRGRRMMLVLDNCEHLVDAAATLVSAILRGAPDTASSRPAASRFGPRVSTSAG